MQQHDTSLLPEHFYHIYNRGVNGTNIFFSLENYYYFLNKYAEYMYPVLETYAYCLLKNHFHLLVRIREEKSLQLFAKDTQNSSLVKSGLHAADKIVSKQFAKFFSSYSQSINKREGRTGSLFEKPFRRKQISTNEYLTTAIQYIHLNPLKHGFTEDALSYPWSSYQSHIDLKPTKLEREKVIEWYGSSSFYTTSHKISILDVSKLKAIEIEFD